MFGEPGVISVPLGVGDSTRDVDDARRDPSTSLERIETSTLRTQAGDQQGYIRQVSEDILVGIGQANHQSGRGFLSFADRPRAEIPHSLEEGLPFTIATLKINAARIRSHREKINALPFPVQKGLQSVVSEERIKGDRIDSPVFKVRTRVILLGFANITALGIKNDRNVVGHFVEKSF